MDRIWFDLTQPKSDLDRVSDFFGLSWQDVAITAGLVFMVSAIMWSRRKTAPPPPTPRHARWSRVWMGGWLSFIIVLDFMDGAIAARPWVAFALGLGVVGFAWEIWQSRRRRNAG